MKIPLMAGSSVPLAERRPPLELPAEAQDRRGRFDSRRRRGELRLSRAGSACSRMVEARAGGETGVRDVQFLEGDALWKAAKAGQWSSDLAAAAMAAEVGADHELVKSSWPRAGESRASREDADSRHRRSTIATACAAWPEGGQQRHPLEFCLPAGGRSDSRGPRAYYVGRVAESQSVQGPVARHPNPLPPGQGALSRRAHAADQRHPRRRHGFAPGWRQDDRHAAARRSPTPRKISAPCARWGPPGRSSPSRPANRWASSRWGSIDTSNVSRASAVGCYCWPRPAVLRMKHACRRNPTTCKSS